MRPWVSLAGLTCVVLVLSGCQDPGGSSRPRAEPTCEDPQEVELGLPTLDVPAEFATTAGRLRIRVTGMSPDALIPIDTTTLFLGEAGTVPHRDPQRPEWPDNASHRVKVSLDRAGYVEVDAGSYWAASSAGGRIYVAACSGEGITDVTAVDPDPAAGFGVTPRD